MKNPCRISLFFSLAATAFLVFFAGAAPGPEHRFLVEAEAFQFLANWSPEGSKEVSGGASLRTAGSQADALTVIGVPAAGTYNVWARARDYATQEPKTRRFRVVIDDDPLEHEAGMHGREGWRWEKVGVRQLSQGDHVLGLRDATPFARCDAIFFTTSDEDPNGSDIRALARWRMQPKKIATKQNAQILVPPPLKAGARTLLGQIANDAVRIDFQEALDETGGAAVVRETEIFRNNGWEKIPVAENEETLFLLYSPASKVSTASFFPFWATGAIQTFEVAGKTFQVSGGRDPFNAGSAEILVGRTCKRKDGQTVEVEYRSASGRKAVGEWHLAPGQREAEVAVTFTADKEGEYSVGFSPFQAWSKEEVQFNLLPPLFNFQRLPEHPRMSMSATTPQALALVQAAPAGTNGSFSFAVVADPAAVTGDWATAENSYCGFSLLNAAEKVQPTIFAPVLGLPDSKLAAGESRTVSWRVLAEAGDWKEALEYVSDKVFHVTDYRRSYGTSLTDTALNIIDLLKDDDHCGWDAKLKGFYNIESTSTASEIAPLALMSAALLTRDEDFYARRALPALEFSLTRPGAHFATEVPESGPDYVREEQTRIDVPSSFFGAAYWQGADDMLGRKNPWLAQFAYKDGEVRSPHSYSHLPHWSDLLATYRLEPKSELLDRVKTECAEFLRTEIYGRQTKDLGIEPFYNVSYYPYWWDLVDLYELTRDKQYLDAAEEGAFHTLAGLWSLPSLPKGEVVTFPGGDLTPEEHNHIWWKGDIKFRLGWPLQPGSIPEKKVPSWAVSRVGLGLEQPSTYYGGRRGFNNILMSAWAPNLLRVYEYTGREIFQTYARNTIIGRFTNYPGYYINIYADAQMRPRYPYEGPDITNIYYHHIPAHLAFTLDFILTEAAVRSKGKIAFPWVKQQGYVWFSNRIYGHTPGTIYGDGGMRLWLDRQAVKVGSDQITYLPARSDNRFSLVLMNESDEPQSASIALDADKLGIDPGKPDRLVVNGETRTIPASFNGTVEVPAKGIVLLSFPARAQQVFPEIPVLDTPPMQQTLTGDWGVLHAFRIRSPFANDSLYVVLTGHPAKGASATLLLSGKDTPSEVKSYPYEFTVYPWPMDRDMTFRVRCVDADGKQTETEPITLRGTPKR